MTPIPLGIEILAWIGFITIILLALLFIWAMSDCPFFHKNDNDN